MPRTRVTCSYCTTAAKAGARCFHPSDRIPKQGRLLVGNPDGSGYSLVWYDPTWKAWAHATHDASGTQTGPGERGSAAWHSSREAAVQDALDHLSRAITARLAAGGTRRRKGREVVAAQFKADMEQAGFTVEDHPDRDGTMLPSVQCHAGHDPYAHHGYDHPDVQDVVRATALRIRWTGMGGLLVALPA